MEADPVLLEQRGGVALLTLNRPHVLNAMNTAMGVRLGEVMDELSERAEVRVVVLTGAGDRAFCAGGDLKERQGMTPEQWTRQHRIFERAHHRIRNLRKPIFAAVNGVAVGGGCEMAMSTDFIVASRTARFGQPEVTRGIMPGAGGTQLLPRFVPRGIAFQLLMTGELISAEEAHRLGLVNRLCAPEDLLADAMTLAERIAANSPAAVQQAKRSARMGLELPLEAGIETEIECYQRMVDHPDRYEGIDAFNERRPPVFRDVY
ncbi:MAG TPA: enoyl-CoA hydratase-related protein [Candidatus Dormibacteraeota bacterium]|nr:enoyl-CoA hydratase-related protein [Candidatus Dormibacteraeota bacterium]